MVHCHIFPFFDPIDNVIINSQLSKIQHIQLLSSCQWKKKSNTLYDQSKMNHSYHYWLGSVVGTHVYLGVWSEINGDIIIVWVSSSLHNCSRTECIRYSIIWWLYIQPVYEILIHVLGHDLGGFLIGILMTTTSESLLDCVRCMINAYNVLICSTYI